MNVAPKWPAIALVHQIAGPARRTTATATIAVMISCGTGGPATMRPLVTSVHSRPVTTAWGEDASACTETPPGSTARTITIAATTSSQAATLTAPREIAFIPLQ